MLYTLSGIKLKLASIATLQYSLNIAFTKEDFSTQLAMRSSSENKPHTHSCASFQVVKPIYSRLNYQEFLYNSIVNTFDSLKMWDMSYIFPATKN